MGEFITVRGNLHLAGAEGAIYAVSSFLAKWAIIITPILRLKADSDSAGHGI
jgi:hypothetical protein